MSKLVIFDTEYLSCDGTMYRLWSAAHDPDPLLVQIGAVLLDLSDTARIADTLNLLVTPRDRQGRVCGLDSYFVELTGISNDRLRAEGVTLAQSLNMLNHFAQGSDFWSGGKDELFALGVSCFLQNVAPSIAPNRFHNLKSVALEAGVPEVDISATNSAGLSGYFGVSLPDLHEHDALDDALSLSHAVLHLLEEGRITRRELHCAARSRDFAPSTA